MRIAVSLLIVVALFAGCTALDFVSYTRIAQIRDNPESYADKQVRIKGRVMETLSIPFVRKGLFQVEDKTGSIWVISRDRMPVRGDDLVVKGKVKTGFNIAGRTFGAVVVENGED